MKESPYVGVTGFMTPQEVRAALRCHNPASGRKLMVGVLASAKTLRGETNRYPNRYPKTENIGDIFQGHRNALNLVHYSSDESEDLSEQLPRLIKSSGPHLDGFQLNVCWPETGALKRFHALTAHKYRIVLQIGKRAMEEVTFQPKALAERVADYVKNDVIDDILIDASGGKGQPLDARIARDYLRAIAARDFDINLGVAGGLCAETLRSISHLLDEFPGLSIDAEGKLRDVASDDLDIQKMDEYIVSAEAYTTAHLHMHRA
jgi:hypothetical protein